MNIKEILNINNIKYMLRLHPKLLQYYYDDIKHDRNFVIEILDSKPYHCFKIKNLPINKIIYCINKTIKNYRDIK